MGSVLFKGILNELSSKTKAAVGGFIPFGVGNDKKLVWVAAIDSMALFLV